MAVVKILLNDHTFQQLLNHQFQHSTSPETIKPLQPATCTLFCILLLHMSFIMPLKALLGGCNKLETQDLHQYLTLFIRHISKGSLASRDVTNRESSSGSHDRGVSEKTRLGWFLLDHGDMEESPSMFIHDEINKLIELGKL